MLNKILSTVSLCFALSVYFIFALSSPAEWMFALPAVAMVLAGIAIMVTTERRPVYAGFAVVVSALSALSLLIALGMAS